MSGDNEDLYLILIAARFFSPLQGLMIILVFCRPHVKTLRNRRPELSLTKALWLVVKSGGDSNSTGLTRAERKTNLRGNKVFLERLERNHMDRMSILRGTPRRVTSSDSGPLVIANDVPDIIEVVSGEESSEKRGGETQSCHVGKKNGEHADGRDNSAALKDALNTEAEMLDLGKEKGDLADSRGDLTKDASEREEVESCCDLQKKKCDHFGDQSDNNPSTASTLKNEGRIKSCRGGVQRPS
jgi:hypothetical protein